MRSRLRTRISVAVVGIVALAVVCGLAALYAARQLNDLADEAARGGFAVAAEGPEPYGDQRRQAARASWLAAAAMALATIAGGLLLYWLTSEVFRPLRRMADEPHAPGDSRPDDDKAPPDEVAAVGRRLRQLACEAADTRSSLQRSRRQLFQAERLALVGKLAASMAHEIRSPLTAIKMWLFAIRTGVPADAELNRKFDIIAEETARLEGMVRSFLEFSRPPAPAPRPQAVWEIIEKTVELARHQARENRIRLFSNEAQDLPEVMADPQQLEQVFLNLLNNAVEAMPEGGEIRFCAAVESDPINGQSVVVRVQDTGAGIPAEVQPRIFEPFYTTKESGTGLGLYIAARIMSQLGGRLVLERSAPGETSFAVWVPAVKSPDARAS